jgi:signal peptidase I
VRFVDSEKDKAARTQSYTPFIDNGPPFTQTGTLDIDLIKRYGLQIPDKMYLALGDNHAMSGDSRIFGFVPQDNLRGGPTWIFWPPGPRWGAPNQPPYPWFTLPTIAVWGTAIVIFGIYWAIHRRRTRLPVKLL